MYSAFKYLFYGIPTTTRSTYDFKSQHPFDKRKAESQKIMVKYPDRLPLIIEKAGLSIAPFLFKEKFLVTRDITIGSLIHTLREQTQISPTQSLYLSINNVYTPSINEIVGDLYDKYKDRDLFLYITYNIT